jgi:GLPGLI family protein
MKFKKFFVLPILCIFYCHLHSQNVNKYALSKVSYELSIKIDKNDGRFTSLQRVFPERAAKLETIASEFDFSLVYNDNRSIFYLERKIYSDEAAARLALIFSGSFYGRVEQQSDTYITEELQEDFGKFLVSRPYQDWELHDESKVIGEYTCFKATTFYNIVNPAGKVFRRDFTAWYTPQLPYKFGPAGYGNLPGLIIELQGKDFTLGVSQIKFYETGLQSKENEMPRLKKLKTITEEEFEKRAAEDEKRWRDQKG